MYETYYLQFFTPDLNFPLLYTSLNSIFFFLNAHYSHMHNPTPTSRCPKRYTVYSTCSGSGILPTSPGGHCGLLSLPAEHGEKVPVELPLTPQQGSDNSVLPSWDHSHHRGDKVPWRQYPSKTVLGLTNYQLHKFCHTSLLLSRQIFLPGVSLPVSWKSSFLSSNM